MTQHALVTFTQNVVAGLRRASNGEHTATMARVLIRAHDAGDAIGQAVSAMPGVSVRAAMELDKAVANLGAILLILAPGVPLPRTVAEHIKEVCYGD